MLLNQLRATIKALDITEAYSPPRVTKEARKFGLEVGEAMDLTTGWDFRLKADRDRAEAYLDKHKPLLVIGSPECKMFSSLQNLTA